MRLRSIAIPADGKVGRIVPSVVLLSEHNSAMTQHQNGKQTQENNNLLTLQNGTKRNALIGYEAVHDLQTGELHDEDAKHSQVLLIRSVKRLLGIMRKEDLDSDWIQSLPFDLVEHDDELWILTTNTTDINNTSNQIRPVDIVTLLLRSIRCASQTYLQRYIYKKHMNVPGYQKDLPVAVLNCVVGVPAYFSQRQIALLEQACHKAGFTGHVSTIVESTAAAMAYGLFIGSIANQQNDNVQPKKRILVLDMGGGTTDITIAEMTKAKDSDDEDDELQPTFTVVVTEGDHRLGGDDMDQALYQWVFNKKIAQQETTDSTMTRAERTRLLRECRRVKEYLCGDGQDAKKHPESCTLHYHNDSSKQTTRMEISYAEFMTCIAPLLERVSQLVRLSLSEYHAKSAASNDTSNAPPASQLVDEVVLVGGGTRVPAVRDLLQDMFAPIQLCLSVNAMSAVAEGAAIQAAIKSHLVPPHELQSALMLDTLPHAIGIALTSRGMEHRETLVDDKGGENEDEEETFVEILLKDAPLPASGSATFTLARANQPGFTFTAVEDVGLKFPLQKIREFTFLLQRLRPEQLETMERRTIEIQMRMETDGKLIVSYFDPNDPEHAQKKRQNQQQHEYPDTDKGMKSNNADPDVMTTDQIVLFVACAVLFILYIVVKLMFHTPEESAKIV